MTSTGAVGLGRTPRSWLGAVLALGLAGCADNQMPVAADPSAPGGPRLNGAAGAHSAAVSDADDDRLRPGEARFRQLDREIPGFGGFAFDRTGNLHVYLMNPRDHQALGLARAALARDVRGYRRGPRNPGRPGSIVVHQADYTFGQLRAWRNVGGTAALLVPGVTFVDLDESRNRIVVGVRPASAGSARAAVEARLDQLAIPRDAFQYESFELNSLEETVTPPPDDQEDFSDGTAFFSPTLQSKHRPIRAGTQIGYYRNGSRRCTLGMAAKLHGANVFLTNAHCTGLIGTNESRRFGQPWHPTWFRPTFATESQDPGFHLSSFANVRFGADGLFDPNGTPYPCSNYGSGIWYNCRRSDMAVLGSNVAQSDILFNRIARAQSWKPTGEPFVWDTTATTLEIDSSNPTLHITGEVGYPAMNEMLDKMGARTGWTYGFVTKTCFDIQHPHGGPGDPNPTNIAFRCQALVNGAAAWRGDSGAPVFHWFGGSPETVHLAGLLWGRATYPEGTGVVFSPMDMIRLDLEIYMDDPQRMEKLKTFNIF